MNKLELPQIEELYPDFPRCPIYAVVDRSKKRRRDLPDLVTRAPGGAGGSGGSVTDLDEVSQLEVTQSDREITTEEDSNKMVKSHSATNSPSYYGELDNELVTQHKARHHKKKKHKKKKEEKEEYLPGLDIRSSQNKRNRQGLYLQPTYKIMYCTPCTGQYCRYCNVLLCTVLYYTILY